jgi:hypothetical protein
MFQQFFRCDFCRRDLKPSKLRVLNIVSRCLAVKEYHCPHCFTPFWRPVGLVRFLMCPIYTLKQTLFSFFDEPNASK